MHGAEPIWPQTPAHFVSAALTRLLRMGFTTVRDVGSLGDEVVAARQAMRYGAFRGPRVLTCGQIISATAPGHRFFAGMYREADGVDDIRRAVREQLRKGADFIKVMSTGARSVELEDPDPAQLTAAEIEAMVDEAHRQGYRTAAHAEGLAGTELSIHAGIDTIEHGMYLNQRPDLLEAMAAAGQILVPTFSCFYGVAGPEANRGPEDRAAARRRGRRCSSTSPSTTCSRPTDAAGRGQGRRDDRDGLRLVAAGYQCAGARADGPPRADPAAGADRRDRGCGRRAGHRRRGGRDRAGQARRSRGRRRRPAAAPRAADGRRADLAGPAARRAGRRRRAGTRASRADVSVPAAAGRP